MTATIHCFVFLLCVAVALSVPIGGNLCSTRHDRQLKRAFCKQSSFVLRASVLSEEQEPSESGGLSEFARDQIYTLNISQIFILKARDIHIRPRQKFSLFVPSRMVSYFPRLEQGVEYLLTGHIGTTRKLRMNLCDWHKKWKKVTPLQRKGLTGQYIRDCYRQKKIYS